MDTYYMILVSFYLLPDTCLLILVWHYLWIQLETCFQSWYMKLISRYLLFDECYSILVTKYFLYYSAFIWYLLLLTCLYSLESTLLYRWKFQTAISSFLMLLLAPWYSKDAKLEIELFIYQSYRGESFIKSLLRWFIWNFQNKRLRETMSHL